MRSEQRQCPSIREVGLLNQRQIKYKAQLFHNKWQVKGKLNRLCGLSIGRSLQGRFHLLLSGKAGYENLATPGLDGMSTSGTSSVPGFAAQRNNLISRMESGDGMKANAARMTVPASESIGPDSGSSSSFGESSGGGSGETTFASSRSRTPSIQSDFGSGDFSPGAESSDANSVASPPDGSMSASKKAENLYAGGSRQGNKMGNRWNVDPSAKASKPREQQLSPAMRTLNNTLFAERQM